MGANRIEAQRRQPTGKSVRSPADGAFAADWSIGAPGNQPDKDGVATGTMAPYRTPVGIVHSDRQGKLVLINERFCDMLGYTRSELEVMSWQQYTHPDDLDAEMDRYERLMTGQIRQYAMEKRYLRKDGAAVWVNVHVSVVDAPDADGYIIAVAEDISLQRRADREKSQLLERERQARRDAQAAESYLRATIDASPEAIVVFGLDATITLWNRAAEQLFGWREFEVLGLPMPDETGSTGSEQSTISRQVKRRHQLGRYEVVRRTRDGRRLDIQLSVAPLCDAEGTITGAMAIYVDVTDRKRMEVALRSSEERYRLLIETSPDAIVLTDCEGVITMANRRAAALIGRASADALLGTSIADLVVPEESRSVLERFARLRPSQNSQSAEYRIRRPDGDVAFLDVTSTIIVNEDGRPEAVLSVARDITDRKTAEAALEQRALYDSLTALPNRALLLDRLQQAILAGQRTSQPIALLLMDLDRFKEINDTFGHFYGDLLLQQVGARLKEELRDSDTVARLGGDEFAALLPATDVSGAIMAARKLSRSLDAPFPLQEHTFSVGASIGIAVFPTHGTTSNNLLRQADVAMYVAKRSNTNVAVYSSDHDEYSLRRLSLMGDLRKAIEMGDLYLDYQPKVNMRTGCARQVEALVRWRHPEHGTIPPGEFIPLAEHMGMMKALSEWVLGAALRECRRFHDEGHDICIAVNLSPSLLHDGNTVDGVMRALNESRCHAEWIGIEITESAVMAEPERAILTLTRLHALGVRIALDDFGTGHSSLAYLKRLPLDELKVDRSFVSELASNDNDAFIARSIIDLGHNLGMQVVAEGVEDTRTLDILRGMSCDLAQGYLFSRPVSAPAYLEWLRARESTG